MGTMHSELSAAELAEMLERQISEYKREADNAFCDEENARQRRITATSQAEQTEAALKVVRAALGILPPSTNGAKPLVGAIPMGTIAEMAASYMATRGGDATVSELVAFLKERGKFSGSNEHAFYGTVFGTLNKHKLFRKVPGKKGRFALITNNGAAAPALEPSGA